MPIRKYFSEGGQLLKTEYEPLSEKNIHEYLEKNGREKTEGYLDGLRDVLKELDSVIYKYPDEQRISNSEHIIRRKLYEWLSSKEQILEKPEVKAYMPPPEQEKSTPT